MAYYDFNGCITIDEDAARRDIQRIREALPYLEKAAKALACVHDEGSATVGMTGAAVREKSMQLKKKTEELERYLEGTIGLIERVVKRYQLLDQEAAAQIRASDLSVR